MAAPFHIPTNNTCMFQFLYILAYTYCLCFDLSLLQNPSAFLALMAPLKAKLYDGELN